MPPGWPGPDTSDRNWIVDGQLAAELAAEAGVIAHSP